MGLAVAQGTSLFITMRKADIEYRLMLISDQLTKLAYRVSQETTDLINQFQTQMAASEGVDEVTQVTADVMTSAEVNSLYNSITLQYQAKEKLLTNEKKQLETQEKALDTEAEWVDKLIESGTKSFQYFQ